MPLDVPIKREREAAEIHRSAVEAQTFERARLVADERNVARYMNPQLDTTYPLEYAFALLGDARGRRVLDFGCGAGGNSLLLARRGARVLGIDISEQLIRVGRERIKVNGLSGSVQFVIGSGHDLPIARESVDIVFGSAILHHLDLTVASREIYRVLKSGGRAIFKEPVRDSRAVRALRKCIPYHAANVSPFERPLTTPELADFSRPFAAVKVRAFGLPFVPVTAIVPALRKYVAAAHHYDARLLQHLPALATLAGVRVVELTK